MTHLYDASLDAVRLLSGFAGILIVWETALFFRGVRTIPDNSSMVSALKWGVIGLGFVIMGVGLYVHLHWPMPETFYPYMILAGWSCWCTGLCIRAVAKAAHKPAAILACGMAFLAFFAVTFIQRSGVS